MQDTFQNLKETLNQCGAFYLGSIGIHQKLDGTGYRLTYPTKKSPLTSRPIFHPINVDDRAGTERRIAVTI